MTSPSPHRAFLSILGCVLFAYLATTLTAMGAGMFTDTDPLWHLASGDLLRATDGHVLHDPWSFTAGNYPWLDISWLWDAGLSYVYQYLGWHGAGAINALTIAATLALIYINCARRSGGALASLLSAIGALSLMSLSLRPLQVSMLMAAGWMLLLGEVTRGQLSRRWLNALPISMFFWVNMHGGFLVGPMLVGAYLAQSMLARKRDEALILLRTLMELIAVILLCTPWHLGIIEAVRRPLLTEANRFILEWQPLDFSAHTLLTHFYLVAFVPLAFVRGASLSLAERALAVMWFALALTASRYLSLFAIIAAPWMACSANTLLAPLYRTKFSTHISKALLACYGHAWISRTVIFLCIVAALWLPSLMAAKLYHQQNLQPPGLDAEIGYIEAHLPHARLLTHFNLGGTILYQTRGKIPVFIDARAETAYPPPVIHDYVLFELGEPGWQDVLTRWHITGVLLPNTGDDPPMLRMKSLPGWRVAYVGPSATLFVPK